MGVRRLANQRPPQRLQVKSNRPSHRHQPPTTDGKPGLEPKPQTCAATQAVTGQEPSQRRHAGSNRPTLNPQPQPHKARSAATAPRHPAYR
jgi:hypothetical protein